MNARVMAAFVFAAASMGAADPSVTARGLTVPVFDASGNLLRRLTAVSASGPLASPRLDQGRVEFFAPESRQSPTATLKFDEALYQKADETISGHDAIKFTTHQGVVSGQGYRCLLDAGLLTLTSDVNFVSDAVRMNGEQAEIRFDAKGRKKDDIIQEIVLTGRIVVERAATAKAPFDRAETTMARYEAGEQKVYLQSPVTTWNHGQKSVLNVASGFAEIDLREKP